MWMRMRMWDISDGNRSPVSRQHKNMSEQCGHGGRDVAGKEHNKS